MKIIFILLHHYFIVFLNTLIHLNTFKTAIHVIEHYSLISFLIIIHIKTYVLAKDFTFLSCKGKTLAAVTNLNET